MSPSAALFVLMAAGATNAGFALPRDAGRRPALRRAAGVRAVRRSLASGKGPAVAGGQSREMARHACDAFPLRKRQRLAEGQGGEVVSLTSTPSPERRPPAGIAERSEAKRTVQRVLIACA